MNSILASLYNCAMSSRGESFLIGDDVLNYHSALRGKEKLEKQLQEQLNDEQLKQLQRYIDRYEDAAGWEHISAFRKGLAVGLKLGAFCVLER